MTMTYRKHKGAEAVLATPKWHYVLPISLSIKFFFFFFFFFLAGCMRVAYQNFFASLSLDSGEG
jgi:hypothetical protein